MILYTNGDSHTAAAECVNNHAFAEDDPQYFMMGRVPHPENLERSWGNWLEQQAKDIYRTLYVIQWSTWEREEWLIDNQYYQINASGIDDVPDSHQQKYKEYVANVDWKKKTTEAHEQIWQFHLELEALDVKHIFFNGNNDFGAIKKKKDWGSSYILPYDPKGTFNSIVSNRCYTVSPTSYHYGSDGHRIWAQYMTKYIVDNQLV